ncbi:MAG: hypothetical protein ACPG4T_01560 [Nannocystaceae bacterium]
MNENHGSIEVGRFEDGELDEIIVKYPGGGSFHLEQMTKDHWWMSVRDAKGYDVHVNLVRQGRKLHSECYLAASPTPALKGKEE